MRHWERLLYAIALGVLANMVFVAVSMVLDLDTVTLFLSPELQIPIYIVAYLLAPFCARYIKRQ